MKRFKNIFFIVLVLAAFGLGWWWGEPTEQTKPAEATNFEELQNLWDEIDAKFIDTREDTSEVITEQDHLWGAMRGLADSYEDPYTIFLSPEDNQKLMEDIKGEFYGVGMEIINRDGLLTVVSPLPDTPAWRAGVRPRDVIIEINGEEALNMFATRAVKLIRGEQGTVVNLKLSRQGQVEPIEVEIVRDLIKIPVVKTLQKNGVFVIKIYSFTENLPDKFMEAIREFVNSGQQKLILDVRGNPGGHLFAAIYILGLFIEEGQVLLTEDYGGQTDQENKILYSGDYHGNNNLVDIFTDNLQLGVLMDEGSASASEILAGVLVDHQKAILFGQSTFGKGTVQELVDLGNETALKVTVAKWILPSGSWISDRGLEPDIIIDLETEEQEELLATGSFSDEIDIQLARTIEILTDYQSKDEYQEARQDFFQLRLNEGDPNQVDQKEELEEVREKLQK